MSIYFGKENRFELGHIMVEILQIHTMHQLCDELISSWDPGCGRLSAPKIQVLDSSQGLEKEGQKGSPKASSADRL